MRGPSRSASCVFILEPQLTLRFNSSSATIRANDDNQRARPLRQFGASLGPSDSVGRELDAIINGQAGLLQSENGVGDNHVLENYVSFCFVCLNTHVT